MLSRSLLQILLIIVLLAGLVCPAWALSTTNVPLSREHLYRDIDKLVALGYVKPTIVGQRPWARSEFARLLGQAIEKQTEKSSEESSRRSRRIAEIIDRLTIEFKEELVEMDILPGEKHDIRGHPLERVYFDYRVMNSPPTTIPYSNGVGFIAADVNPLGDYREGRYAIDGIQASLETVSRFGLSPYFSMYLQPRFEGSIARGTENGSAHALIQNLYGVVEVKNFSFEFGRDSIVWGLGQRGGNMLSTNPRPLDMIKITNPHPARLPWVFRYLGEWRYTLFGANMGPEYEKKYAWLTGWKLNLLPSRWVELGVGHLVMMGGEGTPSLSAADVIGEFFGFRPSQDSVLNMNKANQQFEVELLLRIPPWRGAQIYGSIMIDDSRGFFSHPKTSFIPMLRDGSSYLAGLYLPAIDSAGQCGLRLEYTHTCTFCERHSLFSDGMTINRKLLGSDLGPDADGIHGEFTYDVRDDLGLAFIADWDHRRSDLRGMRGTFENSVYTIEHRPTEDRYRFVANGYWWATPYVRLVGSLGYERVHNYQYVQGDDRNNFLVAFLLSVNLDRYTRFSSH